VIVQHIRQFWKRSRDKWHQKGNDLLIKGYAQFLKSNPQINSRLVLFDYGIHANDTKQLITELGIEGYVTWLPKMQRKHLMAFIKMADVIVGELFHSWLTYCVVLETLSMSKPLIQKRIDTEFLSAYPELYPMLHASTAEEVCQRLNQVANEKEKVKQIGEKAREWFIQYCVHRPLKEISRIINAKQTIPND
jgi:glycosyltransferase involved in cell wall biosynthesis